MGLPESGLAALPAALRARLPAGLTEGQSPGVRLRVGFEPAVPKGVLYLARTHPLVEAVGSYLLDTALDDPERSRAVRAGAIRTAAVAERTVLLLLRGRYVISSGDTRPAQAQTQTRELLGEEALLVGFCGPPAEPRWLDPAAAERLAREARPVANVLPQQAQHWVRQMVKALPLLSPALDETGRRRADALLAAHTRVRAAAAVRGTRPQVAAKLPLDVLGLSVLMPPPFGSTG